MSQAQFVIQTSKNNQYYFNLRAKNHEVILTSELYTALSHLRVGVESVRTHAVLAACYERRTSQAGEPYFVLRAANHEVIGTSEMYSSEQAREVGIAAVSECAGDAVVVDLRG